MLNRRRLNTEVLGAGTSSTWTAAAGAAVLALVGTLSVSLAKYAVISQKLTAAGHLRVLQYFSMVLSGTCELVPTVIATKWRQVYGAAAQTFELVVTATTHTRTFLAISQAASAVGTITYKTLHWWRMTLPGVLRLVGTNLGSDFYQGHAPFQRTVRVPESNRTVYVPSATYTSQVR